MSLSRRDFMKLCSCTVAGLGISQAFNPDVIWAMKEGAKKAPLIWLQGQGCTGCSVSLLNTVHPSIKDVLLEVVSLEYHPTIMGSEGQMALEHMRHIADKFAGKFFLLIEGSIPTAENGLYCIVGEEHGHHITMLDLVKDLGPKSLATVSLGTCSSFGGIPAAQGNLTEAKSVMQVYEENDIEKLTVNVPGCPPHPDWMVGTLVAAWSHVLDPQEHPLPELDENGRPLLFYGENIHENCPYLEKFEEGELAETFTSEGCRYELGCKGPNCFADCFKRKWNSGLNWCVENAVCIGCVEPGFPDEMSPFYVEG